MPRRLIGRRFLADSERRRSGSRATDLRALGEAARNNGQQIALFAATAHRSIGFGRRRLCVCVVWRANRSQSWPSDGKGKRKRKLELELGCKLERKLKLERSREKRKCERASERRKLNERLSLKLSLLSDRTNERPYATTAQQWTRLAIVVHCVCVRRATQRNATDAMDEARARAQLHRGRPSCVELRAGRQSDSVCVRVAN